MREVIGHRSFCIGRYSVIGLSWGDQGLHINHPQSSVVVGNIQPSIPRSTTALIGFFGGFKIGAVKVVRGEEKPFITVGVLFTISTIAVFFCVGDFPISDEFGFELKLAIFKSVFCCIDEIDDARSNTCRKDFNGRSNHVNGFV